MKRPLAIWFCLVLFWAQVSFDVSARVADESAARGCCRCNRMSCCLAPASPAPQTPPASSPPGPSQPEARTVPSTTGVVLYAQAEGDEVFSADSLPFPRSAPVPLYQRTCSFVI